VTAAAASLAGRLPAAVLLLPACFIVEVILGGPFGVYGGVSVRFLLFGAALGVLLFALLVRGRLVHAHLLPILSIVGFLVLNGIWVAMIPPLAGTKLHWAVREPHAFVVLIPVVLVLALLTPAQLGRLVPRLQRLVVATALVLAAFQVGLWVIGTVVTQLQWVVPIALDAVFGGGNEQFYVGPMPDGFFRVFWISTLWCLLSWFWLPVAFPGLRGRWVLRGLLLLDIFASYSRGLWLGLLAGQLVASTTAATREHVARTVLRGALVAATATLALVGVLAATGALERGVARVSSTTSREDVSIGARIEQAPYLLNLWYEHPLVGNGYGAYSPGMVRSPDAPYSYEHMPYALLAKLGLLGVLANGVFLLGWALTAWQARRRARAQAAAFLGGAVALLIADMTNPMVLNFVSMSILACLLVHWAHLVSPPEGSTS